LPTPRLTASLRPMQVASYLRPAPVSRIDLCSTHAGPV